MPFIFDHNTRKVRPDERQAAGGLARAFVWLRPVVIVCAVCAWTLAAAFMAMLRWLRRPTRRGVVLALVVPVVLFLLYVLALIPFTPSIGDIRKAHLDEPARVMSTDGKLLAEFKPGNREWVKLADISPFMIDALISTEDHRFYQHHGLDGRRLAAAMLHTFSGARQGGSTLTQQLARNLYPDEIGRAPTLTRKLKEAITALKIESVYNKNEILETYLNTVPFLYDTYGVEMAARTYFSKSASELTILESATLVGMLKGNSYYNPVLNPERALQRRNTVLAQMVKYGHLSQADYETLKLRPLGVDFERQIAPPGPAPHFAQQVRRWLITWADRNGYNIYTDGLVVYTTIDSRLQTIATQSLTAQTRQLQVQANGGWNARGGCSLHNDLLKTFMRETPEYRNALAALAKAGQTAQAAGQATGAHGASDAAGSKKNGKDGGKERARKKRHESSESARNSTQTRSQTAPQTTNEADADALRQLAENRAFMRTLCDSKTDVQAGFLAIDPRDGGVRAWVGSPDFSTEPFDHVQQARRQPGSTFKAFVYGAAFANGTKPDETYTDQPVSIPLKGGGTWQPNDSTPPSGRAVTLRDALTYSRNRITAQLMLSVGPQQVVRLARAMGVRDSALDAVPSLALGTSPVTLKEMVSAYSTIADGGEYREPRMVSRIEDRNGNVLATFPAPAPQRALPEEAADTLIDVMRDVVNRGTGVSIRTRFGIRADVAGKTGTTQDNTDGWFILMDQQLVAGAWVGFDDTRVTPGQAYWGEGARSALPIVGNFFHRALRAKIIDPRARLAAAPQSRPGFFGRIIAKLRAWFGSLFHHGTTPEPESGPADEGETPAPAGRALAKPAPSQSLPQSPDGVPDEASGESPGVGPLETPDAAAASGAAAHGRASAQGLVGASGLRSATGGGAGSPGSVDSSSAGFGVVAPSGHTSGTPGTHGAPGSSGNPGGAVSSPGTAPGASDRAVSPSTPPRAAPMTMRGAPPLLDTGGNPAGGAGAPSYAPPPPAGNAASPSGFGNAQGGDTSDGASPN